MCRKYGKITPGSGLVRTVVPSERFEGKWLSRDDVTSKAVAAREVTYPSRILRVASGCVPLIALILSVISFTHLLYSSSSLARKIGLQRMRMQRVLKEAYVMRQGNSNLSAAYDPIRRCDNMSRLQRQVDRSIRYHCYTATRTSRSVQRVCTKLRAFMQHDSRLEMWWELNSDASHAVREHTQVLIRITHLSQIHLWFIMLLIVFMAVISVGQGITEQETRRLLRRASEETDALKATVDALDVEAEILNHRFGNKIRVNRLLLETGQYEQLGKNFDSWTWEVEIRRGHFHNLPMAPTSAHDLFAAEFSFPHSLSCFCGNTQPLNFRNCRGDLLSYAVIQHCFLQDIASNIIKYGGGRADANVQKNAIVISNDIIQSDTALPVSRQTGLTALSRIGNIAGAPVTFEKSQKRFTICIACHVEEAPSPLEHSLDKRAATMPVGNKEAIVPSDFHWILLDDSDMICKLAAAKFNQLRGIKLATLCKPSDVLNLVSIVLETANLQTKPIILIMDENVVTLNAAFRCVAETSTNLRLKLRNDPRVLALIESNRLHLISASAAEVNDNTVVCKLGKAMSTEKQISTILDALQSRGTQPKHHAQ